MPKGALCFLSFQGNMQVLVTYGGDPIPKSPFAVSVAAPLDLSKIKINGLENSKCGWRQGALKTTNPDCHLHSLQRTVFSEAYSALREIAVGQTWVQIGAVRWDGSVTLPVLNRIKPPSSRS